MTLREIRERISAIRTEARTLNDAAATPEARARVDELMTEMDGLEAQERTHIRLDDIDRRSTGTPLGNRRDTFEDQAMLVRANDVIRAGMGLTDEGASRAREVSQEIARRSGRNPEGIYFPMAARPSAAERRSFNLTTGNGAGLVQTDIAASMVDILRAKSVVKQLGATVITGLVGNLALPRLSASSTIYWIADTGSLTPSNPTIDQVLFQPHHCGGLVNLSRSLIMQSTPDASQVVENDLAALIATAIDNAALTGSGSSGQPTGILNTSGLTVVAGGTNGLAISWANIQALVGAVDVSNALSGNLGFASNSKVAKSARTTLKSTADTSSNYIIGDANGQLAGYPLAVTQNIPSNVTKGTGSNLSTLIFGDWSSLVIAEWSALDILVNPYSTTAYPSGGVDVRAMATVDIGVRHIAAFAAITDIIAP